MTTSRQTATATEIAWLPRSARYGEKLATPDITIADLIGDVDPIKVAEGRYLSDELTIHYGLIPRTNRGIFCINELPDLAERLQVGLFNLMEESDVQIRGYHLRLPLDVLLVASANPEDYTSRGRIITPLKDRYGAQIRTHYPVSIDDEIAHHGPGAAPVRQGDDLEVFVPRYMKEIIAEITHLARRSADINQRSGVSVRVSIANYETLISNAIRRAVTLGEKLAVPRITDLPFHGRLHHRQDRAGELRRHQGREDPRRPDTQGRADSLQPVTTRCRGWKSWYWHSTPASMSRSPRRWPPVHTSAAFKEITGLAAAVRTLDDSERPETVASAIEFILEGLHVNKRLNKVRVQGRTVPTSGRSPG